MILCTKLKLYKKHEKTMSWKPGLTTAQTQIIHLSTHTDGTVENVRFHIEAFAKPSLKLI